MIKITRSPELDFPIGPEESFEVALADFLRLELREELYSGEDVSIESLYRQRKSERPDRPEFDHYYESYRDIEELVELARRLGVKAGVSDTFHAEATDGPPVECKIFPHQNF